MTQKIQVLLVCDLHNDDTEGSETIVFGLDGSTFEVDVCNEHAAQLRDSLSPFVAEARRASSGGRRATRRSGAAVSGGAKRDLSVVREWARGQGLKVSERGRVAQVVLDQYDAAH